MSKRNRNIVQIKRKISEDKKRLDRLKNQGFIFSPRIYNDLNKLKEKILQVSLAHRIWNKKLQISAVIIGFFFYIRLREASREYAKSKHLLDDILFSFKKDLGIQESRIEQVLETLNATDSKITDAIQKNKAEILNMQYQFQPFLKKIILSYPDELKNRVNNLRISYCHYVDALT